MRQVLICVRLLGLLAVQAVLHGGWIYL